MASKTKVLCRYKVTAAEGSGLRAVGEDWQHPDHYLLDYADPADVGNPEMGRGWRQWDIVNTTTGKASGHIVADLVGAAPPDIQIDAAERHGTTRTEGR